MQGNGIGLRPPQPSEALPFPRRLWAGEHGEGGATAGEKWVPLDHEFDSVKAVRDPSYHQGHGSLRDYDHDHEWFAPNPCRAVRVSLSLVQAPQLSVDCASRFAGFLSASARRAPRADGSRAPRLPGAAGAVEDGA